MDKLNMINRSRWAFRVLLLGIFAVMLTLNRWTPYLVDDFRYMYSFDKDLPLNLLADVISSMRAHSITMNGRLISHGLEQVFLMMPKLVFNLANAAVFLYTIFAAYRICQPDNTRNCLLLMVSFAGLWVFLPMFGQVCLWQVGSLNYLWALAMGLSFLRPFVQTYQSDAYQITLWKKIVFSAWAFLAGAYTEITSFVVLIMAAALTVLICVRQKKALNWLIMPLLTAAAGFWVLIHMPAEAANKAGSMQLYLLLKRIIPAGQSLQKYFSVPVISWAVLMTLLLIKKGPGRRAMLSLAFFLGAIAADFMLIAGSYIVERCLCTTALFLVIANGILLRELFDGGVTLPVLCAAAALSTVFVFSFLLGVIDIRDTMVQFHIREQSIQEQKREGITKIYVDMLHPETEYSPVYMLKDLDSSDPFSWPNNYMAKYYGVDVIFWSGS